MEAIGMEQTSEVALERIIANAVQIPGVKVDRQKFLAEAFAKEGGNLPNILELGPVEAGCSREMIARVANKLILVRTSASSAASFAMGLPGGVAMGATIPADTLQFFGMSMRLAQELAYLYGAQDLWKDGEIDDDTVKSRLIMYCGVMFGVSGAAAGVRILSSQIAKTTLKKLPQKALTKTIWYPIVKQIGKLIGVKVTKNTVAKGVSKAIPVVGGVISGGLNFASMLPMARRLMESLDQANFSYTEAEIMSDYQEIQEMAEGGSLEQKEKPSAKECTIRGVKNFGEGLGSVFMKGKKTRQEGAADIGKESKNDAFVKIEKLAKLREMGAITQQEFENKKAELLSQI